MGSKMTELRAAGNDLWSQTYDVELPVDQSLSP
jgi:hypothetical protein